MVNSWFDKKYALFEGTWEHASAKKRRLLYIYVYTFCFLITFLLAFSQYFIYGKTILWGPGLGSGADGRLQHYPAMLAIGQYIREWILNLVHGEFAFPLFDLGINMGGDIIGALNGNIETDPLYLLSALVPTAYSEYLYCFLSVFRLWLAGLSFSYLCFYHGKRVPHILTGSLIYCFSSYVYFSVAQHPYFLNPMILLPIVLVGIDKILKNEAPWIFIISLCYTAISCGYYCLYQITLMVVIYAIVRFFDLYKENKAKHFEFAVGRGALAYAIGVGLSAVILLPSLLNFLSSHRSGFSSGLVLTNYTFPYLREKLLSLILPGNWWAEPYVAAIAYFAIALLLFTHGKRTLKILLCIGMFLWIDNIGGYIMHGFQYTEQRWVYGLILLLAYITVDILPELAGKSAKQRWVCAIAFLLYMALALSRQHARLLEREDVLVALVVLGLTIWILSLKLSENKDKCAQYCSLLCVAVVIINVGINGIYRTAPDQGDYVKHYSPWGKEVDYLFRSAEFAIKPLVEKNPQGRVDGSEFVEKLVSAWSVPTMTFYDSMASSYVVEFWNSMEIRRYLPWPRYYSTQCTIFNTLLSTKYHIEPEHQTSYIPYGYTFISHADGRRSIYENTYALPWGYTYDKAISYEEIKSLNGIRMQEAMLQAVALDNAPIDSAKNLEFDAREVPYTTVYENCAYNNGILTVKEDNAAIRLFFSLPRGVEGYLRLSGLAFEKSKVNSFHIMVICGNVVRYSNFRSKKNIYYDGQSNYLFNLGYSNEERRELAISLPNEGVFKLDDIKLYALPMENYQKHVEALRAEPLENITWGTNQLTGTVDLSKDKILCVSVPYSKGWTATVDGEKAEILRGNYMFMCLPLTAGHHDIEFNYCSPGLKLGAVITLCSACAALCMFFVYRKRNRARNNTEERSMQNEI